MAATASGAHPDNARVIDGTGRSSRRSRLTIADYGPALALSAFAIVLLILPYQERTEQLPPMPIAIAVALASTVPLLFRRTHPAPTLVLVGVSYMAYVRLGTGEANAPSLAFYVALFSAGAYLAPPLRTRIRAVVVAAVLCTIAVMILIDRDKIGGSYPVLLITAVSFEAALDVGAWLMGDWFRDRDLYERELNQRAQQMERDRLDRERRVVRDERIRIARELHDVVAHHVSLMGIQAGAARTVLPEAPDRSSELLASIEDASRTAVEELHRLLGALREDAPDDQIERLPSLEQLDGLIEATNRAGLSTTVEIRGVPPGDISPALGLSTYRIVQEALTNAIRHAHAEHVAVVLSYGSESIDLRVEDDGRGLAGGGSGGRGLVGMRERAALFGGTIATGSKPDGGFVVSAHLPFPR